MSGETIITVVGNLTADPELRFIPSGQAVANFTLASTPRTFDRQTNEWKDGDTLFLRCSIWRDAAENVCESLQKGMRVIASGALVMRSYETKEGDKRTSTELQVHEIGPSLKSATAQVRKTQRQQGGAPGGQMGQQEGWGTPSQQIQRGGQQPAGWGQQQQDDPWATGPSQGGQRPAQGQQGGWGSQSYDEPPF
jgi:single-strand DNA-binding protein